MKLILTLLLLVQASLASETINPSTKVEQQVVSNDGINFQEWESEFDTSMKKAKSRVRKCEAKSNNCQFEKFQALDPSFDMVH